jgi:pimeloyl-ACP methyl ester carboxylesterase
LPNAAAAADLLLAGVESTTRLVRDAHAAISGAAFAAIGLVPPLRRPARIVMRVERGIAGAVYASIGGIAAGAATIARARQTATLAANGMTRRHAVSERAGCRGDVVRGVLNGAVGDVLVRRGNALAIEMALLHRGQALAPPAAAALPREVKSATRICVFVHGLCCTERLWLPREREGSATGEARAPVSFGARLERDLGHLPLYLRYNSGLPVAVNAGALAALLEELHAASANACGQLVLVGHSMGGLVVQLAAAAGLAAGHRWSERLTHVVCLGTPHRAAPLERAARRVSRLLEALDAPGTVIPARLLAIRSAGVRDLGQDWAVAAAPGVRRLAGAATADTAHRLGLLVGDGLVAVASALGDAPPTATAVVGGVSHLALAWHPDVYERLRTWLSES